LRFANKLVSKKSVESDTKALASRLISAIVADEKWELAEYRRNHWFDPVHWVSIGCLRIIVVAIRGKTTRSRPDGSWWLINRLIKRAFETGLGISNDDAPLAYNGPLID